MRLKFTKMQGVGNDYLYVDAREITIPYPEKLAIQLSKRHFGIGADGLVLIKKSAVADVEMVMYNADGSQGSMCGNAVRCIAEYLFSHQQITGNFVRVATPSGIKIVRRIRAGYYSVQMGKPTLPRLKVNNPHMTAVDVGNPHLVVFPDGNLQKYAVAKVGARLERSPLFSNGVNVEFVQVIGDNVLQMRVWERGSGETLGCGTGACAAVVASVVRGLCNRQKPVTVKLPGGDLVVDYRNDYLILSGDAVTVFEGIIEVEVPHEN